MTDILLGALVLIGLVLIYSLNELSKDTQRIIECLESLTKRYTSTNVIENQLESIKDIMKGR